YNYFRKHGGFGMNRLTPVQKLISTWLQLLGQADPKKVTGILQQYMICFLDLLVIKFSPFLSIQLSGLNMGNK
ncbi:MAG: hypothetical protein K9L85_01885, partial [Candidatus Peribacteraceae bacterium]|nr:hypothetical protein [Candidatus Peribacteraceae bacterium]